MHINILLILLFSLPVLSLFLHLRIYNLLSNYEVLRDKMKSSTFLLTINDLSQLHVLEPSQQANHHNLKDSDPFECPHLGLLILKCQGLFNFYLLVALTWPSHQLFHLSQIGISPPEIFAFDQLVRNRYFTLRYAKLVLNSSIVLKLLINDSWIAQDDLEAKSIYNICITKTLL